MKRIVVIVKDDKVAVAWLELLKISDVESLTVDNVGSVPSPGLNGSHSQSRSPHQKVHSAQGEGTRYLLVKHFAGGQSFSLMEAQGFILSKGFKVTSASPALASLRKAGFVESDGHGTYKVLKQIPAGYKFPRN